LKSGEWFFLFVILDHHFLHAIHLNDWSKFPRPPLGSVCYKMDCVVASILFARLSFSPCFDNERQSCIAVFIDTLNLFVEPVKYVLSYWIDL